MHYQSAVITVWGSEKDFLPLVCSHLLPLTTEFSTARPASSTGGGTTNGGGTSPDAEKTTGPPIAEIMACLGAVWETGKINSTPGGNAWVEEGAAAIAGVLPAATKPVDQTATIEAAGKLAKRCAALAKEVPGNGSLLDPASGGCEKLLHAVARLGEDGKSAAVREEALKVLGLLLEQVWPKMAPEERTRWIEGLTEVTAREKVPSVKSAGAIALASLRS